MFTLHYTIEHINLYPPCSSPMFHDSLCLLAGWLAGEAHREAGLCDRVLRQRLPTGAQDLWQVGPNILRWSELVIINHFVGQIMLQSNTTSTTNNALY